MKTKLHVANGSAGKPYKSSSVASLPPERCLGGRGAKPLAVALGTSNRSNRDTPPKSARQPSLLNPSNSAWSGELGFLTPIMRRLEGKWHGEAGSVSCCAAVTMRCKLISIGILSDARQLLFGASICCGIKSVACEAAGGKLLPRVTMERV